MRWDEIVNENQLSEGTNFHCPVCDENLGKESELDANNSWHCGNCGWSRKNSREAARQEYDPGRRGGSSDAIPVKPVPKSKQSTEKTSGDYRVKINHTKTQADLYYDGPSVSIIRKGDGAGSATKQSDGVFVASWKVDFYNSNRIEGTFPTLTQAVNAIKRMHQSKVKGYLKNAKKHGWKIGEEMIDEDAGSLFMGVASIPNWSVEEDQVSLVFSNADGHECKVHQDSKGIHCEIDHSWDKKFTSEAEATAWMTSEGYTNFVGVDDA